MFQPKVPTMPQPTGLITPPAVIQTTTVTPSAPALSTVPTVVPQPARPVVQITPGGVLALVGAGTAVVLVLGAVLVSLLLAVAITGASVAVCAVVLRSLLASDTKRR
ncbi:SpdD-like protein [Streptomyces sp. NPDC005892]|uniref:SpdD-like protein n=1 Tax=Streptomyces sp. NPDC005892 TaxID=3155593 RepID=UPI0034116152